MLKTSIRNYIEYFPPAVEYAGDDHMLILVMMYFLSEDVKSSGSVQMKIIGGWVACRTHWFQWDFHAQQYKNGINVYQSIRIWSLPCIAIIVQTASPSSTSGSHFREKWPLSFCLAASYMLEYRANLLHVMKCPGCYSCPDLGARNFSNSKYINLVKTHFLWLFVDRMTLTS